MPLLLSIIITVFILPFLFPVYLQAGESKEADSLFRLLPSSSQLAGWKLDGAPQTAVELELFKLINGGAEIYMQEGFKRAIMASYGNKEGKMINLEIYEMSSPDSALRIYKKKIGKEGKRLSIGEDALLEVYYINFRKGPFQVTLSGDDSEEDTVRMLLDMARMVADQIPPTQ
jgi:hypothetical protein